MAEKTKMSAISLSQNAARLVSREPVGKKTTYADISQLRVDLKTRQSRLESIASFRLLLLRPWRLLLLQQLLPKLYPYTAANSLYLCCQLQQLELFEWREVY